MFETGTATDHGDLLDKLNTFLTAKGSAFGLTYAGTGDGTFTAYSGGASSVAETWEVTATSPTSFTVVGSVTGSIGPATVGTPFAHATIEFLLTAGGTAFVSGDKFELSTAPKWTAHRKALGCTILATQGNSGGYAAQNVVDGKNVVDYGAPWVVNSPITLPQDLEFTFREAQTIESYQLAQFFSSLEAYGPKAWTFDYWTGSAWSTLDSESGHDDWNETTVKTFDVGSPVSATKYRLHITEVVSSAYLRLGCVRLRDADDVDVAFAQTIWKAPGNDGDSEILVGVHILEREDADYFDWELASFDGYLASSLWREQAGHHSKLFLPLWDASIPYWFVGDGRRVIVIAKISTQYEVAFLGFLEPYFSPDQWPYPIALGGSLQLGVNPPAWDSVEYRWSNSSLDHSAFPISDRNAGGVGVTEDRQMRARDLSGLWLGFDAQASGGDVYMPGSYHAMWPYCTGLELFDPGLDGGYPLWPIMLLASTPNTIGQLPGVACVSGQGLSAETLIRYGEIDWIALPNITRTERNEWFAIALD